MNTDFDCPLCDWQAPAFEPGNAGLGAGLLAAHLGTLHAQAFLSEAAPGVRCVYCPPGSGSLWCWCGDVFLEHNGPGGALGPDRAMWALHLQRRGGATAHFLALLLGAEEPRPLDSWRTQTNTTLAPTALPPTQRAGRSWNGLHATTVPKERSP